MCRLKILLVIVFIIFIGCVRASFVLTGTTYPPLYEDAQVDVVMRAIPEYKVQQIGIVTLKGGDLKKQIEKAKKIARENGGDVLILSEIGLGLSSQPNFITGGHHVGTYEIRTFEVSKKVFIKK
jgi:hypothetical protein